MNALAKAKARAARQRQHRAKTNGLVPRQHVEHAYETVDARNASLKRSDEALLRLKSAAEASAKATYAHETGQPWALASCPKCGATGDEPCRKPNGRKADSTHKGRGDV